MKQHEYLPAEQSYFGMNIHSGRTANGWKPSLVKQCYNIGAMTIRDDHEWAATESKTEKGKYDYNFPCADLIYNYKMDYIIGTGFSHPLYDNGATPYTDEGRLGFANYSKALYDLYPARAGKLTNMEVFNEWFGPQFGDRGDGPADSLPETYVPLAKKVYEVVKGDYPDSVLFGEFGSDEWNRGIVESGILNYMDRAAIHSYGPSDMGVYPETGHAAKKVNDLKKIFEEQNVDFDIWVTETGMNTAQNGYYNVTQREQAVYTPRLHFELLEMGVKKIIWYDLLNDGTSLNSGLAHEDNYGLLNAKGSYFGDYTPKPAYVSYGVMTRVLDGLIYAGKQQSGDLYCYTFAGDSKKVSAMYAISSGKATVRTAVPVTVISLMGEEKVYTPSNGSFTLDLSDSVQYIEGDVEVIFE